MIARALVSGALFKTPQTKISKAGKPDAFAIIREGVGERVRWWKCFAFSESVIEEIMRLGDGDPIAVAGEFDCELYSAAGGESRLSWRIRPDAVLSARAKPKMRQPKTRRSGSAQLVSSAASVSLASPAGDPDDAIPF